MDYWIGIITLNTVFSNAGTIKCYLAADPNTKKIIISDKLPADIAKEITAAVKDLNFNRSEHEKINVVREVNEKIEHKDLVRETALVYVSNYLAVNPKAKKIVINERMPADVTKDITAIVELLNLNHKEYNKISVIDFTYAETKEAKAKQDHAPIPDINRADSSVAYLGHTGLWKPETRTQDRFEMNEEFIKSLVAASLEDEKKEQEVKDEHIPSPDDNSIDYRISPEDDGRKDFEGKEKSVNDEEKLTLIQSRANVAFESLSKFEVPEALEVAILKVAEIGLQKDEELKVAKERKRVEAEFEMEGDDMREPEEDEEKGKQPGDNIDPPRFR
jgi:hypothetical protein